MIFRERILLSRAGGGTGPVKPGNHPRNIRGKGANLERRISSWKIRGEKGERLLSLFLAMEKGFCILNKIFLLLVL